MIREDSYPIITLPSFFHKFRDCDGSGLHHNEVLSILETNRTSILEKYVAGIAKPHATVKKGFTEHIFSRFLKLRSCYTFYKSSSFGYSYSPDLLIVDSKSNFIIDIEIDEPYSYPEGTPIHCYESGYEKDAKRDAYFSDIDIMVIRFAEEQIVNHPQACLDFITTTIEYFYQDKGNFSDKVLFNSWGNWNEDLCIKRWDKEDALEMAKYKYRNSYLPIKYLEAYESILDQLVDEIENQQIDKVAIESQQGDIFSMFKKIDNEGLTKEAAAWTPKENATSLEDLVKMIGTNSQDAISKHM